MHSLAQWGFGHLCFQRSGKHLDSSLKSQILYGNISSSLRWRLMPFLSLSAAGSTSWLTSKEQSMERRSSDSTMKRLATTNQTSDVTVKLWTPVRCNKRGHLPCGVLFSNKSPEGLYKYEENIRESNQGIFYKIPNEHSSNLSRSTRKDWEPVTDLTRLKRLSHVLPLVGPWTRQWTFVENMKPKMSHI